MVLCRFCSPKKVVRFYQGAPSYRGLEKRYLRSLIRFSWWFESIIRNQIYLSGVVAAYESPKLLVGVRFPGGMPNNERITMSQKETIEKAYGHIPKEISNPFSIFDWVPEMRGVRYYIAKLRRVGRMVMQQFAKL